MIYPNFAAIKNTKNLTCPLTMRQFLLRYYPLY